MQNNLNKKNTQRQKISCTIHVVNELDYEN